MPLLLNWPFFTFIILPVCPTSGLDVNGRARLSNGRVNWVVVLQEMGGRKYMQDKRHVDTLVTARTWQTSPMIQDKRDIAQFADYPGENDSILYLTIRYG